MSETETDNAAAVDAEPGIDHTKFNNIAGHATDTGDHIKEMWGQMKAWVEWRVKRL